MSQTSWKGSMTWRIDGGGPGEVKPLLDDGVPPGPEEEQDDLLHDEVIHRRLLLLEEKVYRRGHNGCSQEGDQKGGR